MFNRFMRKYGRAISDEKERVGFYRLYIAKTVMWALCIALLVAMAVLAIVVSGNCAGESLVTCALVVMSCEALVFVTSVILSLVLGEKYRGVLRRAPSDDEMPEIIEYRKKVYESIRKLDKATSIAWVFLTIGIIAPMICFIIDFSVNIDSTDFSFISHIGLIASVVCVATFAVIISVCTYRARAKGCAPEMAAAREAEIIDKMNGVKHEYRLEADKNAFGSKYLLPNTELYAKFDELSLKQQGVIVPSIMAALAAIICWVIFANVNPILYIYRGYLFPVLSTVMFLAIVVYQIPLGKKIGNIEKQQKSELEKYPMYEKNLKLFQMYESFAKGKGRIFPVAVIASIIVAWVFAAVFPNTWLSATVLVFYVIGAFVHQAFFKKLRAQASVIENEIDDERDTATFSLNAPGAEESAKYTEAQAIVDHGTLKFENAPIAATDFLYAIGFGAPQGESCGKTAIWLGFDNETKRVCEIGGALTEADFETAEIAFGSEQCKFKALRFDYDGEYPKFSARKIQFPQKCYYDKIAKIIKFGELNTNGTLYRIFGNVYIGLTEDKELTSIIVTDVELRL